MLPIVRTKIMITVFYDGKCGLCRREISYYKRIAPKGVFAWQDIANQPELLVKHNIDLVDALMELHAIDDNGKLHKGLDGFIIIWQHLKWFKILSYLVRMPGAYSTTAIAYRAFTKRRFRRLAHCQAAKDLPP